MDIKKLWSAASISYETLENDRLVFDSYCEEISARLALKKGEIKKLIEAQAIVEDTGRITMQLDLFENPPLPKNVQEINKKAGVSG